MIVGLIKFAQGRPCSYTADVIDISSETLNYNITIRFVLYIICKYIETIFMIEYDYEYGNHINTYVLTKSLYKIFEKYIF